MSARVLNPAMMTEMSRNMGGGRTVPSRAALARVRRDLFGPVDHAAARALAERELRAQSLLDNERWGFDFRLEIPKTNSRYQWELVTSNDVVPEPYALRGMPYLRKHAPSTPRKKRDENNVHLQQQQQQQQEQRSLIIGNNGNTVTTNITTTMTSTPSSPPQRTLNGTTNVKVPTAAAKAIMPLATTAATTTTPATATATATATTATATATATAVVFVAAGVSTATTTIAAKSSSPITTTDLSSSPPVNVAAIFANGKSKKKTKTTTTANAIAITNTTTNDNNNTNTNINTTPQRTNDKLVSTVVVVPTDEFLDEDDDDTESERTPPQRERSSRVPEIGEITPNDDMLVVETITTTAYDDNNSTYPSTRKINNKYSIDPKNANNTTPVLPANTRKQSTITHFMKSRKRSLNGTTKGVIEPPEKVARNAGQIRS